MTGPAPLRPPDPASRAAPIILSSAHGERRLFAATGDCLLDVCSRYGIPAAQVSAYLPDDNGVLVLSVDPHRPIDQYVGSAGLVLIPNRNIDYLALLGGEEVVHERPGASTWLRTRTTDGFVTEHLRPQQALQMVTEQVSDVMRGWSPGTEPLVVGVSGGGDSNALLAALCAGGLVPVQNIHPVMMMGIPDWDDGQERAQEMCRRHGLELRVVTERETAAILGFRDSGKDWVTAFERQFPGDDLEVLGVYAVRRVLEAVAGEFEGASVVLGHNLEDCLADALYHLCAGRVPFPRPRGRLGQVDFLYPLWLTPKSLIDGCFPAFSLANYQARYPSRMRGRAYFYYLARMFLQAYPGAGQDLLRGTSDLSAEHFRPYPEDAEFGTPTARPIPLEVRVRLRRLFGHPGSLTTDPLTPQTLPRPPGPAPGPGLQDVEDD